jgi:1-acyl-sn-glycerol-3-phosphate acyltransferase
LAVFYWLLKHLLLGPLMRLTCHPKVQGADHIPDRGGAILASNHLAVADSFFLPLMIRRRLTFLAKREYFTTPGVRGWLKRQFFNAAGQVPIDRSSASAAQAALDTGVRLLAHGKLLGIYPEGTRSPDGRLYKGKTGVARMALEAGVPVIPCAMVNTHEIQPPGKVMPKLIPVVMRIGKPLDFSRYAGMEDDRFVLRSMTDEIMYELMQLSGQEYVDTYATKAKADIEDARNAASESMVSASPGPQRRAG